MRTVRTVLLAGAAALGIAGLAGLAMAAGPAFHEITVLLPGGGVEHIRYTGNVAPKVDYVSGPAVPVAWNAWSVSSPFAELDRISAIMDRQMSVMMQQAQAMQQAAFSGGLDQAVMKDMPAGTSSYSFVSTMSGNGVCSRSVQITSSPNGGKPKVVSHTSGNCGSAPSAPANLDSAKPAAGVQTISWKGKPAAPAPRHGI